MGRWREFLSVAGIAAVVVLAGAVFSTLDPMGLDAAADRHSADVISRVSAPFYGGETLIGRDRITVVEISDSALREMAVTWPPPRAFYTDLLDTLVPEKGPRPTAIFLDYILLSDLRDPKGHAAFIAKVREITNAQAWENDPACRHTPAAKIACIRKKGGTPVILGKPYPADVCSAELGDDVSQLAPFDQAAVVAPLGWPGAPEKSPPLLTRKSYEDQIRKDRDKARGDVLIERCRILREARHKTGEMVQLAPAAPGAARMTWWGVPEFDLTPAAAAFAALCRVVEKDGRQQWKPATCGALFKLDGTVRWLGPKEPVVTWGSRPDPNFLRLRRDIYDNARAQDGPCRAETQAPRHLLKLGWAQLKSAIGGGVAAVEVPCAYHPTFDYAVLKAQIDANTEVGRTIRDIYLRDRVVMVGAALVSSTDWIQTVVNGRQAGVHYHAMMLDNLMEEGATMLREPPEVFAPLKIDQGELLEFAAAFLVAFLIEAARRPLARRKRPDGWILAATGIVFVWAFMVMAAATVFTITQHWKPVNIVGLATLTVSDTAASFWSIEGVIWFVCMVWTAARTLSGAVARATGAGVGVLGVALGILYSKLRRSRVRVAPQEIGPPEAAALPEGGEKDA